LKEINNSKNVFIVSVIV